MQNISVSFLFLSGALPFLMFFVGWQLTARQYCRLLVMRRPPPVVIRAGMKRTASDKSARRCLRSRPGLRILRNHRAFLPLEK